jgi:hypothetical protein
MIVRKPQDLADLERFGDLVAGDPKSSLLLMFASGIGAQEAIERLRASGIVAQAGALAEVAKAWPAGEVMVDDGGRRVLVVAGAERFSDQAMGFSEKVTPTPEQRALFGQAFAVIDRLADRPPPSASTSPAVPPVPPAPEIPPASGAVPAVPAVPSPAVPSPQTPSPAVPSPAVEPAPPAGESAVPSAAGSAPAVPEPSQPDE